METYEIEKLGDQIADLTIKEAKELSRYLNHFFGDNCTGVLVPTRPNPPFNNQGAALSLTIQLQGEYENDL